MTGQVVFMEISTNLLDLPSDVLADVLGRSPPFRCRQVCRAFCALIGAGRTSIHLSSLTTNIDRGGELRALLNKLPGLTSLVASDGCNIVDDSQSLLLRRQWLQLTYPQFPYLYMGVDFLAACPQLLSLRLEHCTWLQDLSAVPRLCTGLQSLSLHGCREVRDVAPLARCPRLTSLSLSGCRSLFDMDALAKCTQLQTLAMTNAHFTSVAALTACSRLTLLTLDVGLAVRRISDMAALSSSPDLLSLSCSCIHNVNLAPMASCHNLTSLSMPHACQIVGIDVLTTLNNLQRLDLASGSIAGFEAAVKACTALTWLDLSDPRHDMPDVKFLSSLIHLAHLDLSRSPQLTNLTPLTHCVALSSLNMSHCSGLASITPLSQCGNLRSLALSHDRATAQLPLMPWCSQITALRIEACGASSLDVLADCPLVDLHLDGWLLLTDTKALAALLRLSSLHVSNCVSLVDIRPVASSTHLTSLRLRRCSSLSDISPISALPLLQLLDVAETAVADITPLTSCALLTELDLCGCVGVSSIAPLAAARNQLRRLNLRGCSSITDLSVFLPHSMLMSVLVDEGVDTSHLGASVKFRIGKRLDESY